MKRLFIKSILLLMFILPNIATAQDFELRNINYHIEGDHAIVTTGSYPYSGDVTIPTTVFYNGIEYPVTAIDQAAFRNCYALTSVTIPSSITAIGENAFAGCTALDSVEINDLSVWCGIQFSSESSNPCKYAHRLFLNGTEIVDLVIPDSVSTIFGMLINQQCYHPKFSHDD